MNIKKSELLKLLEGVDDNSIMTIQVNTYSGLSNPLLNNNAELHAADIDNDAVNLQITVSFTRTFKR